MEAWRSSRDTAGSTTPNPAWQEPPSGCRVSQHVPAAKGLLFLAGAEQPEEAGSRIWIPVVSAGYQLRCHGSCPVQPAGSELPHIQTGDSGGHPLPWSLPQSCRWHCCHTAKDTGSPLKGSGTGEIPLGFRGAPAHVHPNFTNSNAPTTSTRPPELGHPCPATLPPLGAAIPT